LGRTGVRRHVVLSTSMRKHIWIASFLLFSSVLLFAAAGKVERIEKPSGSPVPDTVWQALDPKGYRVLLDDGSVACEVWFRASVPDSGNKESGDALYPELARSTMVGVISIPKAATDYRGDAIRPGFYTLRYELLPSDGNHLGVAPNPDFLLAIPVTADPDPKAEFKDQELIDLSRKTTGTRHPAVLNLAQAGGDIPGVSKDEEDHWIFSVKLRFSSGEEIPVGMVVKGTAPQ
jgi:hypothetical protein